jgi:PKD repeat protein
VNEVQGKARVVKASIALLLIASLAAFVSGCWPFNEAPLALFTASTLSGTAPLSVNFSAILSSDSDGIIVDFEWDFGDGSSGSGESVSHTYTTAGTRTVVLRVTDDDGARATASKTITVNPADTNGDGPGTSPSASFTATPLTGPAPLTVTFNASASSHAGFTITAYFWTFDDGTTGAGMTTTHTYAPSATRTYHVVLRIISSDNNKEATTSKDLIVTVSGATPPSNAPTASFTANPNTALAPGTITFDPDLSSAATGRTLSTFVWSFGDGSTYSRSTDVQVTHKYYTPLSSKVYTVTLTVLDDLNNSGSASRSVTINDWQPIAGFEMKVQSESWGVARVADIVITGAGDVPQTVSFRSFTPTNWTVVPLPKTEGTKPTNFETAPYTAGDKNLSYDPEGQSTVQGWGITTYLWSFDGGGPGVSTTQVANLDGSCTEFQATFQLGATDNSRVFNVSLTVVDAQGAQNTKSRKVTLNR